MDKDEIKLQIQKYIEEGMLEEAEQAIRQYKKIVGYDDEIASMEAVISVYAGDYKEALNCIKAGLEINIFNGDLYFTMGNVYEMMREYNRAYLCYSHALAHTSKEENANVILNAINNLKCSHDIDVKNYSIVMLTYNNLDYTKVCIDSIRKYNAYDNCEIIIIDNNSTDGTVEWIKEQQGIKYILNNENKGFPAGCNQGIEISDENNDIFLLNNDTVIMPNSIFNLRMGLYLNENIGATGSVSNSISYYQQVNVNYDNFDRYIKFASKNNITNEDAYEERIKLVGFAMLIKRTVLDKVGNLDERFTPGNYEDDDISFRIMKEGYKLVLCKDSYIHHFGSVSFKENNQKYGELLSTNSKKFKEKWGFVSEYSSFIRNEIVGLIERDRDAEINVLEVGCACGATLLAIKNKYPNSNLYGIEFNEGSASIAKCFANVTAENVESSELSYDKKFFDYIIFADVLEHLYNPQKVLENVKEYLKDDGYVLSTIPNVMHFSVVKQLINGRWTYEEAGILDKTHIRFFTKDEIIKLFDKSGYIDIGIGNIKSYVSLEDKKFIEQIGKISVNQVEDELETYQYLVRGKNYSKEINEIEQRCTFLLRRIEFDIDIEESVNELVQYLREKRINEKNIINVVERDIIKKVYTLNFIAIECIKNELLDIVIPLLKSAYEISPGDSDTNYNLAYVLNLIGENNLAIDYLNNLYETNEKVEELRHKIGGYN